MSTSIWLTDEPADLAGYRRAVVGSRGDCPSLVRSVTATAAGPTSGIQITRTSGGTALAWITDPLVGASLTAATWEFHVWAKESAAAANAALRFQVLPWTVAEETAALDDNGGTELGTTIADYARTSGVATLTTLVLGDRLVFKVLVDDATALSLGASETVTVSYGGQAPRAEGDSYIVCPDTLLVAGVLPQETITAVRRILRQEVRAGDAVPTLLEEEITSAWTAALREYSRDRPLRLSATLSGDGTTYLFPLPRGWIWGQSSLVSVEYPAGEQTPVLLDIQASVSVYASVLGIQPLRVLRFQSTPASGTDNIIVTYTSRHVHTTEASTIPVEHLDALASLAAAHAAEHMAAWQAGSSEAMISADSVNHQSGVDYWRAVARMLRSRYTDLVGGEMPPASAVTTWTTPTQPARNRRALVGWWGG